MEIGRTTKRTSEHVSLELGREVFAHKILGDSCVWLRKKNLPL